MPGPPEFDELTKATARMLAKVDSLAAIEFAQNQCKIRMLYYAQTLETERQVRHAQRMDAALDQLIVHVVVSIATVGLAAAVEAVMAGAYAAEGAYATAQGIRYARAAQALEEAMATKNFLDKVTKVVQIARNPALRNILIEYKAVEFMVKAPAMGINAALEAWAQQTQGKDYEFEVPDAPGSDGGTFWTDDKGKRRKPGLDFLKVAKQVYDRWGAEQASERKFVEAIAKTASTAYNKGLSDDLSPLSRDSMVFLSMNRGQFSELDGRLEIEVNKYIKEKQPGIGKMELRLARATALRGYWSGPWNTLVQRKPVLLAQIARLTKDIEKLETSVKLALNRRPAVRSGSGYHMPGPGQDF